MTKILIVIVVSSLCIACGAPSSEPKDSNAQDKSLRDEPETVKRIIEFDSSSRSKVELADTEVRTLVSKFTLQSYDLYIKFPNGYEAGGNYPVLYVLDAEVNFGGVSYIVQRLIRDELIPGILVVGIAYQGETSEEDYYAIRQLDFTPTVDKEFIKGHNNTKAGGAENFTHFLESELFPFIDKNYKTSTNDRALYGHSFGGLFGFYTLLNKPGLFSKYILLSPSLWWDNRKMSNGVTSMTGITGPQVLYVATGEKEGVMVDDQLKLVELLKLKIPTQSSIKSEILANETHRSIFGIGFTNGLRFIYSGKNTKAPAER